MVIDYDCVIVGGSFVGATLALALKDSPLNILVIDQSSWKNSPSKALDRSIALSKASQQLLKTLNVWQILSAQACPIRTVHVSDKGCLGFTRLEAKHYSLDALGYVIPATPLQRGLRETLLNLNASNITIVQNASVLSVNNTEQYAELTYKQNEQEHSLRCGCVVAADGGRSFIREHLNFKTQTHDYQQTAIIANINLKRDHDFNAYERFTPQGAVAFLPIAANTMTSIFSVNNTDINAIQALSDKDYLQFLQKTFGYRCGKLLSISPRHVYPLKKVTVKKQTQLRSVLIGNAAHSLHPISGQGLNLGLRDAVLLAEQLKKLGSLKNYQQLHAALHSYQESRQHDHETMIDFTHDLVKIFNIPLRSVALLRSLGLVAVDSLSPLKNKLLKHTLGYAEPIAELLYED